ncbi:MAG: TolC family protein, partial [Desulfovermiculus sp.]
MICDIQSSGINIGKLIIIAALICIGGTSLTLAATAQEKEETKSGSLNLDLEQAVKLGLEQNPRIKGMEHGIESSQSAVKSARGGFLPKLSAGYSRTYMDNISAEGPTDDDYLDQTQDVWRVSLVQTLFAGKTILNTYQKAQIEKEASRLEKQKAEMDLIRQIQEEFLKYLKVREDRRSLEDTIRRLQVGREAAQAFVSKKMAPFVDVLQAEVELEDARQELSKVQNEEQIHKMRLNAFLGLQKQRHVTYSGDLADVDLEIDLELEKCRELAKEQRVELQFILNNIQIATKEKQIAQGRKWPTVNLELSAIDRSQDYDAKGSTTDPRTRETQTYDRDRENQYWTAGINVEWEFFSGGEQHYQAESMEYEIKKLQRIYEDDLNNILT